MTRSHPRARGKQTSTAVRGLWPTQLRRTSGEEGAGSRTGPWQKSDRTL